VSPSRPVIYRSALFFAYLVVTASLALHHEPWRDEADAWLIARDASPLDVLRIAGHSGTPCLWYFAQMPLAKAGLPFGAQAALNLAFMLAAAAILLRSSKLPLAVQALFLFGYYMSFEYAVVARNYGLGVLLAFAALAWDERRIERPFVYGLLLLLLANVSAHFLFIAAVLLALWLRDLHHARKEASSRFDARAAMAGVALAGLGAAFSVFQLLPRPGGQFPQELLMIFVPRRLFGPIRALFPEGVPVVLGPLAVLAWGSAILFVASQLRALLFLGASVAALTYIFVFKHVGGDRHYGLLLIVLVMALWLAENDRARPTAGWPRLRWPGAALTERLRRVTFALVGVCLGVTALFSVGRIWPREIGEAFSEAQEMGHFLRKSGLDARTVAAHPSSQCEAVLPYLERPTFFYPALSATGSHMLWDARYMEGTRVTLEQAVTIARRELPDFRPGGALFLSNTELPAALAAEFRLIHRTAGKPWRVPDEAFFLYEPVR